MIESTQGSAWPGVIESVGYFFCFFLMDQRAASFSCCSRVRNITRAQRLRKTASAVLELQLALWVFCLFFVILFKKINKLIKKKQNSALELFACPQLFPGGDGVGSSATAPWAAASNISLNRTQHLFEWNDTTGKTVWRHLYVGNQLCFLGANSDMFARCKN